MAIKFGGLTRRRGMREYVDRVRPGLMTRACITWIMNLLNPGPDVQEDILSLAGPATLASRSLWERGG